MRGFGSVAGIESRGLTEGQANLLQAILDKKREGIICPPLKDLPDLRLSELAQLQAWGCVVVELHSLLHPRFHDAVFITKEGFGWLRAYQEKNEIDLSIELDSWEDE